MSSIRDMSDLREKLDAEVAAFNGHVQKLVQARRQVDQLEAERVQRLGRIEMLSELVRDNEATDEEAKDEEAVAA